MVLNGTSSRVCRSDTMLKKATAALEAALTSKDAAQIAIAEAKLTDALFELEP